MQEIKQALVVSIPLFTGLDYNLCVTITAPVIRRSQSLYLQGWITTDQSIAQSDDNDSLNPFIYRAGLQPIKRGMMVFPLESQSLYLQGWITTIEENGVDIGYTIVSIPLFTGLDYNRDCECAILRERSLNPFIYRAGLQRGIASTARSITRLNPFIYRAGLQRTKTLSSGEWSHCLNPFIYRAGLQQKKSIYLIKVKGLNPFIYRAGLQLKVNVKIVKALCLNPFIYRAGLQPDVPLQDRPRIGSQSLYLQGWITTGQQR